MKSFTIQHLVVDLNAIFFSYSHLQMHQSLPYFCDISDLTNLSFTVSCSCHPGDIFNILDFFSLNDIKHLKFTK